MCPVKILASKIGSDLNIVVENNGIGISTKTKRSSPIN